MEFLNPFYSDPAVKAQRLRNREINPAYLKALEKADKIVRAYDACQRLVDELRFSPQTDMCDHIKEKYIRKAPKVNLWLERLELEAGKRGIRLGTTRRATATEDWEVRTLIGQT